MVQYMNTNTHIIQHGTSLPEQTFVHGALCTESPGHGEPPFNGCGLVHIRVRL